MTNRSFSTGEAASAYVIAASPRTGSSWLCTLLASSHVAGKPTEYAREGDEHMWRRAGPFESHLAYFLCVPALCSTANGVLGLKLIWNQVSPLVADIRRYTAIREQPPGALAAWLGDPLCYFWLRRRDRIRQAVSFARALQTNRWASTQPGNGARPVYRRDDIEGALARVSAGDEGWSRYFETFELQPHVIWYEDLVEDTAKSLDLVLTTLGLPSSPSWSSCLESQTDTLTEDWVARFLSRR